MSRYDGEGDTLAHRLGLEPGEVHALTLLEGGKGIEVRRRFDEKPYANPRIRHLKDVDSFIEYTKTYGDPSKSLVLFDSLKGDGGGKAVVVIDEKIERGHREFGVFRPEFSSAWLRWKGFLNNNMSQRDFLDRIEDFGRDILGVVREIDGSGTVHVAPGGAAALRVALANLVFGADIEVKSTQAGEHDVLVSFQRKDKAESTRIPSEIALSIPVFVGEEPRTVVLRLKTNDPTREGGRLVFSLRCPSWQDIERASWDDMLGRVRAALGTEFHVLRGDFGSEPGESY